MYNQFRWTAASTRRNRLTAEYEPLQPYFLTALAARSGCRTFVDVGANVGAYSLFATLVPSIDRVICFEADARTLTELQGNVKLNGLDDIIQVEGKAVSNQPGSVQFGIIGHLSGANSVVATSIHDRSSFGSQVMVQATTLDLAFEGGASGPLCLKIDVEGHEEDVLKGGENTLKGHEAVIQIECYDQRGTGNAQRLERLGYRRLTAIGPDLYLSNIAALHDPATVVAIYEQAASELIAGNHREKGVKLDHGDFAFEVRGRSADLLRSLKRRLVRR